jgi:TldD protein
MERLTAEQYLKRHFGHRFDLEPRHLEEANFVATGGAPHRWGEVYGESTFAQSLSFDQGNFKDYREAHVGGMSVRVVEGERVGFYHTNRPTRARLLRAAKMANASMSSSPQDYKPVDSVEYTDFRNPQNLYPVATAPILVDLQPKIDLLRNIDALVRAVDPRIKNVQVSIGIGEKVVVIQPSHAALVADYRPMIQLRVVTVAVEGDRREIGFQSAGFRADFDTLMANDLWKTVALDSAHRAINMLGAVAIKAGTMPVVLGPGLPGVLVHEAVGHPLERDGHFKKTSAFAGLMGEMVASEMCTIIDRGNLPGKAGSLNIDDEGNPAARGDGEGIVLIEKGRLVNLMSDERFARLMGQRSTGSGRRENYACAPMPRMTNTMLLGGTSTPEEVIGSVDDGLYCVSFAGGMVDQATGKFTFSCDVARRIRGGKLAEYITGATLGGDGPTAMKNIKLVANDLALDPGTGLCGKQGQNVPVGLGVGTVRIDGLNIGGE